MLKSNLAIFTLLLFFLSGCSESIRELESRIKKQAEKNNTEMSAMEIKQTAIYLNEWSKEDFFQDDVNEFLEADKADFPEGIEILFAGSSSIRFWKSLEKDMNPLKVLNRGFGGTNDIAAHKTPEETIDDFKIFLDKVRTNLPSTHVFVIGIKPSVAREYLKEEELSYNKSIQDMSRSDDLLTFIDVWDEMLTDDGKPNPDLYVDDGLHMNEKGYVVWTKLVRENLDYYFNL